jgi:Zn-dependent protease with chaperone function
MQKLFTPLLVALLFAGFLLYSKPDRSNADHSNSASLSSESNSEPTDVTGTDSGRAVEQSPNHQSRTSPTPKRSSQPSKEVLDDIPDDRPLPTRERGKQGLIARTLGEHFRSHPDTTERILHLRQLGTAARNEPPPKPGKTSSTGKNSPDLLDLAVDFKNRAMRVSTEVFGEVVGPLSVDEEWELGEKVHLQLIKDTEIDPAESERITRLAAPLLLHLRRTKGKEYSFTVVRNDQVNAFAHHGGHVYVNSGLMELLKHDYELLFVLGHEVAHIERGHCAKAATSINFANQALGEMATIPASILHKLVSLSYSEFDEHDADAWSYKTLREMGIPERDIVEFFYTLLSYEESMRQKAAKTEKA